MYTAPRPPDRRDADWGKTLSRVEGSPVLRLRKTASAESTQQPSKSRPAPTQLRPAVAGLFEGLPIEPQSEVSLELLVRWLLRGWMWIVLFAIIGTAAAVAFGMLAKPRYTVTAEILVDPTDLKVVADDVFTQNNQRDSQLFDVESKLTILTSGNVLNRVVDTLKLAKDPEFVGNVPRSNEENRLEALRTLGKQVAARREERSFIVSLDVWSQSAAKSVKIANTIVSAFQDELVGAQADGAGRAAKELFSRLDDLKEEVAKSDQAVQRFKRENNLQSSSGELVSTLIANQVNTAVIDAQTRVIAARSRYEKLSTGSLESRMDTASIRSETITALRTQYALAKKELDAQSAILGMRHPKIVALKPELAAVQSQITQETTRILEAAKSELAQAESALMAQQSQANIVKSTVFEENASLVQLRELEREAQSKATVYEAFMARAKQIAERQQIDATNVRIISPANLPKTRSYPPRMLYLTAGGMIGGMGMGCALVISFGLLGMIRQRFGS